MMTAENVAGAAPKVSVIVTAYASRARILAPLTALRRQSLDPARFEVIVVVNGADDGTRDYLRSLQADWAGFNLRIVTTPVANASAALNLGLELAEGDYVTVLDDDDWVSPRFLEVLLLNAAPDRLVLAPFCDVSPQRDAGNFDNYLNRAIFRFAGRTTTFEQLPQASSANCGKLLHRDAIGSVRFDAELRTGMDVAFWSQVIVERHLQIHVLAPLSGAVYYRELRTGSISRSWSRQFVLDRIHVIAHLEQLAQHETAYGGALRHLAHAQAAHLGSYIREHPDDEQWVRSEIDASGLKEFDYASLNERAAATLVIAYAFPPFADTSAMVMARRLNRQARSFDVVVQDMSNIRTTDDFSESLVKPYLGRKFTVPAPATFGHWGQIERFVDVGMAQVDARIAGGHTYQSLYSRAMFPASHILAALIKVRYPQLRWVAEFSDPLRHDSSGAPRIAHMPESVVRSEIQAALTSAFPTLTSDTNMWSWIEDFCFGLADEVVFTNDNQRELMTREAPPEVRGRIAEIGVVSPHPTLPAPFYQVARPQYELPSDRVNLGYFGVFYASRGVGELTAALADLPGDMRDNVLLHVFTNKPDETRPQVEALGLARHVRVNGFVPYLDFLNLSTRFDWLVVSDARVSETHGINPYLPSKYSDYAGSGTRILGLVEPGSALDALRLDAKAELGDTAATVRVLTAIANRSAGAEGDRRTDAQHV